MRIAFRSNCNPFSFAQRAAFRVVTERASDATDEHFAAHVRFGNPTGLRPASPRITLQVCARTRCGPATRSRSASSIASTGQSGAGLDACRERT